ncbi:MAG: hypothetical protein A2Y74_06335 [Actinobacteria bacterium RBG_13_63_9]|nr:MAG: hypothetical protein A2Y74_06335 [Actinobacteria bacterium RBG_13_63_9]
MNPKRRKHKQINRRKARRITPLRIVGWASLLAFVGLAAFLTLDLVRSRGGVQQSVASPVTTPAAATAEPYMGGARLFLPATEVDLGQIPLMREVSYSFDLENVGDAPLVISDTSVYMLEGC